MATEDGGRVEVEGGLSNKMGDAVKFSQFTPEWADPAVEGARAGGGGGPGEWSWKVPRRTLKAN